MEEKNDDDDEERRKKQRRAKKCFSHTRKLFDVKQMNFKQHKGNIYSYFIILSSAFSILPTVYLDIS